MCCVWDIKYQREKWAKEESVCVKGYYSLKIEAINYTSCLFHPVPRELGFFTPASVIESVTLATRLRWSGRLITNYPGTSSRVVLLRWRWSPLKTIDAKFGRAAEVKRWICRANEIWGGFWTRDQLCLLMFTFWCFTIKVKVVCLFVCFLNKMIGYNLYGKI